MKRTVFFIFMIFFILSISQISFARIEISEGTKKNIDYSVSPTLGKLAKIKINGIERIKMGFPDELRAIKVNPKFKINLQQKTLNISDTYFDIIYKWKKSKGLKETIYLKKDIGENLSFPASFNNVQVSVMEETNEVEFFSKDGTELYGSIKPTWFSRNNIHYSDMFLRWDYNGTHLIMKNDKDGFKAGDIIDPSFEKAPENKIYYVVSDKLASIQTSNGHESIEFTLDAGRQPYQWLNITDTALAFNITGNTSMNLATNLSDSAYAGYTFIRYSPHIVQFNDGDNVYIYANETADGILYEYKKVLKADTTNHILYLNEPLLNTYLVNDGTDSNTHQPIVTKSVNIFVNGTSSVFNPDPNTAKIVNDSIPIFKAGVYYTDKKFNFTDRINVTNWNGSIEVWESPDFIDLGKYADIYDWNFSYLNNWSLSNRSIVIGDDVYGVMLRIGRSNTPVANNIQPVFFNCQNQDVTFVESADTSNSQLRAWGNFQMGQYRNGVTSDGCKITYVGKKNITTVTTGKQLFLGNLANYDYYAGIYDSQINYENRNESNHFPMQLPLFSNNANNPKLAEIVDSSFSGWNEVVLGSYLTSSKYISLLNVNFEKMLSSWNTYSFSHNVMLKGTPNHVFTNNQIATEMCSPLLGNFWNIPSGVTVKSNCKNQIYGAVALWNIDWHYDVHDSTPSVTNVSHVSIIEDNINDVDVFTNNYSVYLIVKDPNGIPVQDSTVTFTDTNGNDLYTSNTNENGIIIGYNVPSAEVRTAVGFTASPDAITPITDDDKTFIQHNPYNITVNKTGYNNVVLRNITILREMKNPIQVSLNKDVAFSLATYDMVMFPEAFFWLNI